MVRLVLVGPAVQHGKPTKPPILLRPPVSRARPAIGVAPLPRCYTLAMPTTRPRHVITETEQVVRALDDAARRWPADSGNRAKLLARLVEEGHRAVVSQLERDAGARRDGVTRTSGVLTGAYGDGYLAELRKDWPE